MEFNLKKQQAVSFCMKQAVIFLTKMFIRTINLFSKWFTFH